MSPEQVPVRCLAAGPAGLSHIIEKLGDGPWEKMQVLEALHSGRATVLLAVHSALVTSCVYWMRCLSRKT